MRNLLPWAAMLAFVPLMAGVHLGAQTKAPARKPAAKTTSAKTTASKTARKPAAAAKKRTGTASSKRGTASASARRRKGTRQPVTTWRNRQSAPTPERYREIQSALAAKGYLPPESATGEWNQASMDALKRFQSDQNLEPTGKLNALSLIGLGLGPRYEAKGAAPPPVPAPPSQN